MCYLCKKTMSYSSKNRHRYYLKCHLIFVCKYRKKLLVGEINDFIKQTCCIISLKSDFAIDIMESDKDHMHFFYKLSSECFCHEHSKETQAGNYHRSMEEVQATVISPFLERAYILERRVFCLLHRRSQSRNNQEIYREPRIGCSSCANSSNLLKTNGFSWHVFIKTGYF